MGPAAEGRPLRRPRADRVPLGPRGARLRADARPVELHIYVMPRLRGDRAPRRLRAARRAARHAVAGRPPRTEDLARLPGARRADRRLLPGRSSSIGAARHARGPTCSTPSPRAQLAVIYRLKQDVQQLARRLAAAQRLPARSGDELPLLGLTPARTPTCATSATTSTSVIADLHRDHDRPHRASPTRSSTPTPDRLNRMVTLLTLVGSFFLAWTLVTGFFGQNFGWLVQHIDSRTDFLIFGVGALVGQHGRRRGAAVAAAPRLAVAIADPDRRRGARTHGR